MCQRDIFEPSPSKKIFSSFNELSLISELLATILSLIFVTELMLQFSIIIEFSILDTQIVELSPTLTLGPIEEFARILQLFPIMTGPTIFTFDSYEL